MAQEDPRIRVIDNPRRSVASGLNAALSQARGRWVARMDAHTTYPPDYLQLGIDRLSAGDARWVSGPQIPEGDNIVSRAVAVALSSPLGRGGSRKWGSRDGDGPERELDSGVFTGVWERSTLFEYSGWDERWPRNSDSELAGRFLSRGERLICLPAMGAAYVPRGTLRGLWRQYLDYGEFRAKTARRHPHTMRRSHLLPPAVVLDATLAVAGPRTVRGAARWGLIGYGAVITAAGATALRSARGPEALHVPVVLAIMHFAHGVGFIRGAVRHGVPVAAIGSVLWHDRSASHFASHMDGTFSPSLSGPPA
jgi:succinoglycan biosynthesis protein ExoA